MKHRCIKCGSSDLHFDAHAGHAFCKNCKAVYVNGTSEIGKEPHTIPAYVKLAEYKP